MIKFTFGCFETLDRSDGLSTSFLSNLCKRAANLEKEIPSVVSMDVVAPCLCASTCKSFTVTSPRETAFFSSISFFFFFVKAFVVIVFVAGINPNSVVKVEVEEEVRV